MKKIVIIATIILVFSLIISPNLYATKITLNTMLAILSKPSATSLQKTEFIEKCKGLNIKGNGVVNDIRKSFSAENAADIYIKRPYGNTTYEIVLTTSADSVLKVKKGMGIKFDGKFVGVTFETLRFEDVAVKTKPSWFPYWF